MQLNIESVKQTSSGKSLIVKAGGKDYFAKVGVGLSAGMTVDAETEESEFNGKTNVWIKKWKPAQGATQSQATGTSNGSAWLPFASNTVAHAISSGLITSPEQVKAWAAAAKQAYQDLA